MFFYGYCSRETGKAQLVFCENHKHSHSGHGNRNIRLLMLERELGFKLLERKNRSFTLTPAGAYFYQKSLILTADCERMCSEAARIAKGDRVSLKIGYLRCYTGTEFQHGLALFSEKHPDVEVSVISGSHEELYGFLRTGEADLVLNDQRWAFSDEYVNFLLTTCRSYMEVSAHSPLAQMERISPPELKTRPAFWSRLSPRGKRSRHTITT